MFDRSKMNSHLHVFAKKDSFMMIQYMLIGASNNLGIFKPMCIINGLSKSFINVYNHVH